MTTTIFRQRAEPKVGNYVLILQKPEGYPDVNLCTLGHVVYDKWLATQGILNVDVLDSRDGEVVNLTFYPWQLRRIDEEVLQAGRLPPSMDRTLLTQYETLKNFR